MSEGHRVVTLESPEMRVRIDVDRGAHIFEVLDLASGVDVLYRDPKGWRDHDIGGWYELLPNAGPPSHSPAVPFHGDVRDLPWRLLEVEAADDRAVMTVEVESKALPLRLRRTMAVVGSSLEVSWELTNLSSRVVDFVWGQHITFGAPFVSADTRIDLGDAKLFSRPEFDAPVSRVRAAASPTLLSELPTGDEGDAVDLTRFPVSPASEMLFADSFSSGAATVRSGELAVRLEWDSSIFEDLWIWMENGGMAVESGSASITALAIEPQVSAMPTLDRAIQDGSARALGPGRVLTASVSMTLSAADRLVLR